MIQLGTMLRISDRTGVVLAQCLKVLKSSKKIAVIGQLVLISVRWNNIKRLRFLKARWRRRFLLGTLHRALIIRVKKHFCRIPGIFFRFDENAAVLVNRKVIPVSNRIYGPLLKEFCIKWPSLGCVSKCII